MNEFSTVSIIIPARNEAEHLPGCLSSIFELDYPVDHIEVIVVDNGSTDDTREIAARYEGVSVLRNDTLPVSGLRNLGARHAHGDFLAFLDADCIVSSSWIRNASVYFNNQDVIVFGSPPILPPETTWVQRAWFLVRGQADLIQDSDWLETMNFFIKREHFLEINGFNESLITCEDVDFCMRAGKHGRIVSDRRIEVTHLGEADTVREFIRKELWRGKSNLAGIRSHGLSLKELPSLAIPVYFGLLIPAVLIAFCIFPVIQTLIFGSILFLLPSTAVLFKVRRKKFHWSTIAGLLLLIQIYFLTRTISIIRP